MLVVSGVTHFEFQKNDFEESPLGLNLLNLFITICSCLSVILYLYEIHLHGIYLKWIGLLNEQINSFAYFGIFTITLMSILMFIHQIYEPGEKYLESDESYWDGEVRLYYGRVLNEYLTIIQITVHIFVAAYLYIR